MSALSSFPKAISLDSETVTAFAESPVGTQLFKNGTALDLLEFAKGLCKEELLALQHGYIGIASANYAIRSDLIEKAWERHHASDQESMKTILRSLNLLQDDLIQEAQALQIRMRAHMNNTKKESRRLGAYKKSFI